MNGRPFRGSVDFLERFWGNVREGAPDDCWPWTAGKIRQGYGQVTTRKRGGRSHRIAWTLANGVDIPDGLCACHTCDNPSCANPAHIFLGTHRENFADSVKKRRRWYNKRTKCRKGLHEATPDNFYLDANGVTRCAPCSREVDRRSHRRRKAVDGKRMAEVRRAWRARNRDRQNALARERYRRDMEKRTQPEVG